MGCTSEAFLEGLRPTGRLRELRLSRWLSGKQKVVNHWRYKSRSGNKKQEQIFFTTSKSFQKCPPSFVPSLSLSHTHTHTFSLFHKFQLFERQNVNVKKILKLLVFKDCFQQPPSPIKSHLTPTTSHLYQRPCQVLHAMVQNGHLTHPPPTPQSLSCKILIHFLGSLKLSVNRGRFWQTVYKSFTQGIFGAFFYISPESESALKQIAGLRQVWRHIIAHMVYPQCASLTWGLTLKYEMLRSNGESLIISRLIK